MLKSNPENAADVEALTAALAELPVGETLAYEAMTETIGRDIRAHRYLLLSARDKAEEQTGALFDTVHNVGVKRLASSDMPDVGLATVKRIRRAAKRGVARLGSVRANDMPKADADRLIAFRSQLGAISLMADGRKTHTVAAEVEKTGAVVPAGRVLDMFKK